MGDRYDSSKGSEDQSSWSWRTSQAQSSSRYAATTNSLRSSTSDDRIAVLAETTRRAHEGRDDKQRHRSPQQGGWKDHRRQEYSATSRAMVRPDQPQNSLSHVDNLELSPAVPSSRQRYDAAGEHQWKESSSTFSSSPRHDGRDGGVDGSPPGRHHGQPPSTQPRAFHDGREDVQGRTGDDRIVHRRSLPLESSSAQLERRRRDPRLAHKADGQPRKVASDPGRQGRPRAHGGESPTSIHTAPPRKQQPAQSRRCYEELPLTPTREHQQERLSEDTTRGLLPLDRAPQACGLSVTLPPTARMTAEGTASVSPRPSSGSAPSDPRRRRLRPSPRAGSGGGAGAAVAAPSTGSQSPTIALPRSGAVSTGDALSPPRRRDDRLHVECGSGPLANMTAVSSGTGAAATAPSTGSQCLTISLPRSAAVPTGGTLASLSCREGRLHVEGGSGTLANMPGVRHGTEIREVKRELRPADPRVARRPSDTGEHDGCVLASVHTDRPRPDRRKGDGESIARWEEDIVGIGSPLAVSVQGVTLGGRSASPSDDAGGAHVRLPLCGQHPPAQQVLPQSRPPPPPQERNSLASTAPPQERNSLAPPPPLQQRNSLAPPPSAQERNSLAPPSFCREELPSSEPPSANRTVHDFVHRNSASPPTLPILPGQQPWLNKYHLPNSLNTGNSGGEGSGCAGGEFQHGMRPSMDFQPIDTTSVPDVGSRLSDGGQRRSAYAQAMHNKRFLGSATVESGTGGPGEVVGAGSPGGGTGTLAVGVGSAHPPIPQRHLCPQFPRHDYPPEPVLQGQPPPVRWEDDFGGHGVGMGVGGEGYSGDVDQNSLSAPVGGQAWGSLCEDAENVEAFPLVHTSPEWTPGIGSGTLQTSQQNRSPQTISGETRAEFVRRRGAMAGKGRASMNGKGARNASTSKEERSSESDPKPQVGQNDQPAADTAAETPRSGGVVSVATADVGTTAVAGDSTNVADAGSAAGSSSKEGVADAGSAAGGSSTEAVREQRLEPAPLAKVLWSVGDLANRFPRIAIPDSLTHVVASWTTLDTRAIGVIPMLCQPIADRSTEGGTSKGEREERTSQGKRKRARDENEREAREGDGAPEIPHRRAWEARVLVPFGLLRAKAAEGCWAEALQLVLTPSAAATATKGQETGGRAEGGDLVGPNGGGAESVLTLPGGLWDAEEDGGDPESDDNRALIGTAIRACKSTEGVDLTSCSRWLKFCELHEEERTTVVFLCGGGVRSTEDGARGDVHVATISDLIRGSVPSEAQSGGKGGRCLEAAFEAKLGAEFLWGLVSRDWAGVMLDSLRLQAAALDNKEDEVLTASNDIDTCCLGRDTAAGTKAPPDMKRGKAIGRDVPMVESPAEVRAAFGLLDLEGKGWVAGERLEACLVDAGFRLSARYLKSLLRRLCRVAEDGKRVLFEYRRRLATEGDGAGQSTGPSSIGPLAGAPVESAPPVATTTVEASASTMEVSHESADIVVEESAKSATD